MHKIVYLLVGLCLFVGMCSIFVLGFSPKEYINPYTDKTYSYTLCNDGWTSHSQGRGTCSHHRGIKKYIYTENKYCEDKNYPLLKNDKCYKQEFILVSKEQVSTFSQKSSIQSSYYNYTSSSSYSDIGVPFNSWIAGSIQKTYTRQGDSVNVNSPSYSSSLFLSTSFSLSSSASSLSSENSLFNSSIQSLTSKNKIENFVGKIGNQPIEINIDPVSTIKDKIIYKSGVIKYIKAANTPIPIDYMEVKDVECEDSFSLCSSIIIQEKVENGGQIVQTTILNKQSKEKKIGNWQWQSQGGDIIYDVIWDNEIFPN